MANNKIYKAHPLFLLIILYFVSTGCKKEWLDKKPDKGIVVPATLKDFEALLHNDQVMNLTPGIEEVVVDDYYITYDTYQILPTATERNAYVWNKEIYEGETNADWNICYKAIFFSNVVLEGLQKIIPDSSSVKDYNNIKGSALFFRAFSFYNLSQVFAAPFDGNAKSTLGIPLRLGSDVNLTVSRGTLQQTYQQIETDLKDAAILLPKQQTYKTQPSSIAANALLARMFLSMQDYDSAYIYADNSLKDYNQLLDYNGLDITAYNPVAIFNPEVIFHSTMSLYTALYSPYSIIDTSLYKTYDDNDLRRDIFFADDGNGNMVLRSSYGGSAYDLFSGLATDELYLIKAECLARKNNTGDAMEVLNNLLNKRFVTGKFKPLTASSGDEALKIIVEERRKELIFHGLRWSDLRRLNKDARFAKTLYRNLNGQQYSIKPNSLLYVFPIPPDEISLSGIEQNPR